MTLKVLVADDDEGMRLVLRKAVEKVEGFTIIGEAEDGNSALELVEELKPDIIFLDVEMPVLNGIECAKKIVDVDPKALIIFATAHEEYMLEAFNVYAFDYLVKPFKVDRIHQTLMKIKRNTFEQKEEALLLDLRYEKNLDKLIIRNKEGISFIGMKEIVLIERENRSTVVYTNDEKYITSESLGEIEERLDKNLFFRCHKSYIINLSRIHKILPYGRWTYIVKLKDYEKDALLTHDRYEILVKVFGV